MLHVAIGDQDGGLVTQGHGGALQGPQRVGDTALLLDDDSQVPR